MLLFGLRLGTHPRVVATGTPKPVSLIQKLIARQDAVITTGTTYENIGNLAPSYRATISAYEGTALGRQEIWGELLEDMPGALWRRHWIDDGRISEHELPELERVVVGVDPAVTASRGSHETGIVACAISKERQYFVLEDAFCRATPRGWAERVSVLSEKWNASRIVCESNQGGMLVEELLRSFNSELP